MATTYTVALQNKVSGEAQKALADVERLTSALNAAESRRAKPAFSPPSSRDWERTAQAAQRAADREQTAQLRLNAEAMRSAQQMEDAKRNAALRRLQAQQREEEKFTRYKIGLMRKEAAEQKRIESERQAGLKRAGGRATGLAIGAVGAATSASLAGGGYVLGQAFDTAKQIEQAKMRLTALLGSQDAARAEITDMVRAAAKTKFDWQDLVDATSSLSASFGDTAERRYVLGSLADMVSVAGGGKQQLDQVVLAINQVVGKGKLEAEELNQLIEPLRGVVSRRDFYLEVAKLVGVSGKDEQDVITKMQKLQKQGGISSTAAVQAVTTVGRRKAGSDEAGSYAVKTGASIEGQISNIKTGVATLFALSDMEKWTAFAKLREFLADVADFFDADSVAGKNFMDSIRRGLVAVEPQIDYVRKQFKDFTSDPAAIDRLVQGVIGFGQALYFVAMVVADTVLGVLNLIGAIKQVSQTAAEMGNNIATGLANGVRGAGNYVITATKGLATSAIDTVSETLGIRSPSRVMMEKGGYAAEGFALGMLGGRGDIASAARALGDAGSDVVMASPRGAGSTGASGGLSMTNYFQITGNIQDAQAFMREVGPLLDAQAELMFDRVLGRYVAQGAG